MNPRKVVNICFWKRFNEPPGCRGPVAFRLVEEYRFLLDASDSIATLELFAITHCSRLSMEDGKRREVTYTLDVGVASLVDPIHERETL